MTKANDLASLLDANGDVVSTALDNVSAAMNDASALSTGTLPDGRFPATLPAVSGANLTNLPVTTSASDLTSGTLPDARFPATLPAVSGANLTGIPTPTLTSLGIANHNQVTVTSGGAVTATSFAGNGASLTGIQAGAGYFDGNNGAAGDTTNGKGDIFRVHSQTLTSNVTIGSTDNALAVGPLTIDSSTTLTVNGNLTVA